MILGFPGGARPDERTHLGKKEIEIHKTCSAVCLKADDDSKAAVRTGSAVLRGTLLGESGGMPVYSSIAGIFRGILELEGLRYFVVISDGHDGEEPGSEPERRVLTELTCDDIAESARKFSIVDTRSGMPLWKLLKSACGKCSRIVIDGTETDAASAINYRLGIEQARAVVGGAKILLRATGATKCVFAAEYYRKAAFAAMSEYADDEKLFAMAQLDEKYPYGDRAIMYALYVKELEKGKTALDEGVLIVAPETAIALYSCMVSGRPQLDRYITVCGEGIKRGANLRVPRGITLHDISKICGGIERDCFFAENSLLSGKPVSSAVYDSTHALIAVKPKKKLRRECISCGKCAEVCPVRLMPFEVLAGDGERLEKYCVACGACEFICPSGIPLLALINKEA